MAINEPDRAEGIARIWARPAHDGVSTAHNCAGAAPLDVQALLDAAVGAGKKAEVLARPAAGAHDGAPIGRDTPLEPSEREELLHLRRRVQELETAIGSLAGLLGSGGIARSTLEKIG